MIHDPKLSRVLDPSYSGGISRRGLLKALAAAGGAAAGARILGPLVPDALAAGEPSHFVHIFFNGGLNALFSGCANLYATAGTFGVTNSNIKRLGTSDVYTDASTFGQFAFDAAGKPTFANEHWAAIGMKHGNALHTTPQNLNSGGERAIIRNGGNCYLTQLAYYMGGDSAFKAVYFGDRPPAYQAQPAFQGVPIQRIVNLADAIKAAGSDTPDPNAPNRALAGAALETSEEMSKRQITTNPGRLTPLTDAYTSAVASLRKPAPKPVTLAELNAAYGLNGRTTTDSYASMLAGAELMIRAAGTNVVNITDFGLASWDFHQTGTGGSLNGSYSRQKMLGQGIFGGAANRIAPIKTFLERMLNDPTRNVVVCISGELVRLPSGDHGDGTLAVLLGKHVKQGLSFPVTNQSRFAAGTPGVQAFWAAAAAALKVPGTPFGANPHSALIA
jgi:hypothetical protein